MRNESQVGLLLSAHLAQSLFPTGIFLLPQIMDIAIYFND